MSDERFTVDDDGIYDTQEKKHFKFIAYDWIDCDIYECCEKLNEQQATICKLQDLCGKSDYENAKLRLKNKELQEEIKLLKPTNVEQYEQIVQLQEENEQLRENLHNCRLNKNIISEKLKLWQDVHKKYNIYSIKDFEKLMKKIK